MGGDEERPSAVRVSEERRQARSEVIDTFRQFVPLLQAALGVRTEVVLHDLSLLPNSIVAISGDVTGRRIGGPATDVLLDLVRGGGDSSLINYRTEYPEGRPLRSSTLLIRDSRGVIVAALCINTDMREWMQVREVIDNLLGEAHTHWPSPEAKAPPADAPMPGGERFASNVSDLAAYLVERAITDQAVPVPLMRKTHRLAVVRALEQYGLFEIRDGVPLAAQALQVSRFTIYNYLNELNGAPASEGRRQPGA